jgi:hypothetical protein
MTWETWLPTVPSSCGSAIPSTAVRSVTSTSMPTWASWPIPAAIIPVAWFTWPYDWWWKTGCPTGRPPGTCGETIGFSFPGPRSRTGWRPRGKNARQRIVAEYLDGVLADFSGYIAADELYDGPFCVVSIVDNRTFKRLLYEVLGHDPTHDDMTLFFRRFRKELDCRGLTLQGTTTDGSPLYGAFHSS